MKMKTILCMTLLSLCAIAATAQETFTDGDFTFTVNDENVATLTGYTGSGGDVIIPGEASIDGTTHPVTALGDSLFKNNTALTSVKIPNPVTSIGHSAFWGCYALTSVEFPNSLTTIGREAFFSCALTSVEIPNSVTNIGIGAFSYCSRLTSVTISNSVTTIEMAVFWNCNRLTSVAIPHSVTSIEARAFEGCSSLTSVEIPNSVTEIRSYAFYGCSSLTSVAIPNSVTSIEMRAFGNCTGLTDVSVSWPTPLSIEADVFYNLTLGAITLHVLSPGNPLYYPAAAVWQTFRADNSQIFDADVFTFMITGDATVEVIFYNSGEGTVTIPARVTGNGKTYDVTAIGSAAFMGRTSPKSVHIPSSVTRIGAMAFEQCSNLTSVELLNSVTSIGEAAFWSCSSLTSVTIPNSVTSIERYTFGNCTGLTSVELPNSVTSIGEGAFSSCYALISFELPNSVTSIGKNAFYGCGGLTDMYVSWATPLDISADVFSGGSRPGKITLHVPEGTEAVYGAADTWKEFLSIVGDLPPLAVVSPEAQKVWSHGGALHVHTPQAERIEVYALSGQRLYTARKDAGQAVFSLTVLPRGLLIVRGSAGWTEKIINN